MRSELDLLGDCRHVPTSWFYPPWNDAEQVARARGICRLCPIQVECLMWAMDQDEPDGMWGGTTPEERLRLLTEETA